MRNLIVAFGQTNPMVGDFAGNIAQIKQAIEKSSGAADLLVLGELALCGYPLGDLSYRRDVIDASMQALQDLVSFTLNFPELTIVVGHASHATVKPGEVQASFAIAHNSASAIRGGMILGTYHKRSLPNFDVFDDWRNFVPGADDVTFEVKGTKCAIAICQDIWAQDDRQREELAAQGVELLAVPNGSPYTREKQAERLEAARSFQNGFAIAYANLSGGQDELVFDGRSFLIDKEGSLVSQAPFEPGLHLCSASGLAADEQEVLWKVLVTGLRDYLCKTRQSSVVLGLSGGIDSALCAAIAIDAIGAKNVYGVGLPSRYSSDHSLSDAEQLAKNLGINYQVVPIDGAHKAFEQTINLSELAQENIQARIRAVILMGISNTSGQLLLSTGNKSEIAVGYSTMYGDAAGGFAPIKDLYKTDVWAVSRWLNDSRGQELIPWNSIEKAPSAELRPDQKDQDSLPEYEVLDRILKALIEDSATVTELVSAGLSRELVQEVDAMVRKAEWKRSQGAIGTKTTRVAFGTGRRVPLTTRFEKL